MADSNPRAAPRHRLRVVLEGASTEVVAVTFSAEVGGQAVAQATIPWVPGSPKPRARTVAHLSVDGFLGLAGEVLSSQETDSESGPLLILSIADLTTYWTQAQIQYMTGWLQPFGPSQHQIKMNVSGVTKSTHPASDGMLPRKYLLESLSKPSRNYPGVKGLLGGALRLLEDMTGAHEDMVSPFWAAAEARLRLFQQIGVARDDASALDMIRSSQTARKHLRNLVRQNGNNISFAQAVDAILGLTHYLRAPVLFPSLRPGYSFQTKETKRVPLKSSASSKGTPVEQSIAKLRELLRRLSSDTMGQAEGSARFDAVAKLTASYLSGAKARAQASAGWLAANRTDDAGRGPRLELDGSPGVIQNVGQLNAWAENSARLARKGAAQGDVFGATDTEAAEAHDAHALLPQKVNSTKAVVQKALDAYLQGSRRKTKASSSMKSRSMPERLPTTLLFPLAFFAPPPVSNLVFEDDVFEFSFTEQHLTPPTRMLVVEEPERRFLRNPLSIRRYRVYPNVPDATAQKLASAAKTDPAVLLPHEKLTGIVPAFLWAEDLRLFGPGGKQSKKARESRLTAADDKTPEKSKLSADAAAFLKAAAYKPPESSGGAGAAEAASDRDMRYNEDYIDSYASYEFWKRRLAPNSATFRCTYSPELVTGLPCAVFRAGRIIVGLLARVKHVVTEASAHTEGALAYARTVGEDYLLGMDETRQKKKKKGKRRKTKVRILSASFTVSGSDATLVQAELRVGGKRRSLKGFDSATRAAIEKAAKARAVSVFGPFSSEDGEKFSNSAFSKPYPTASTYTAAPKEKKSATDAEPRLSFEEVVRPAWLDPTYDNRRIGRVYEDLIGCGSVIDRLPTFTTTPGVSRTSELSGEEIVVGRAATVDEALLSIQKAYTSVKGAGGNTHEFVAAVRRRKGAGMPRIVGATELGDKVPEGTVPFHAFAFGALEHAALPAHLDPRVARLEAVQGYLAALDDSPGIARGVGGDELV